MLDECISYDIISYDIISYYIISYDIIVCYSIVSAAAWCLHLGVGLPEGAAGERLLGKGVLPAAADDQHGALTDLTDEIGTPDPN